MADANDPTDVDVQLGLAADTSEVNNVTMRIRIYVLYDDTASSTAPGLLVQPNTLNFTTMQGTNPAPQIFTITNTRNAPLNWAITEDANAAMYAPVTPTRSTLAPGQSATITVAPDVTQASAGTINGVITVADSDPGTTVHSQQVAVTFVIQAAAPAVLSVTPTSLMGNQGCQLAGGNYVCAVTLTHTSQMANLNWTTSANSIPSITFSPATGTLAPGQSALVEVSIAQNDCANGAVIVFTGPANSVAVPGNVSPDWMMSGMRLKIRILIINDEEAAHMQEDLANADIMRYYWSNTGEDVKTFWLLVSTFRRNFPELRVPEDFALYDEQLLIKYDEERQTVTFDVLENMSDEAQVFKKLEQQLDLKTTVPFIEILPGPKRP